MGCVSVLQGRAKVYECARQWLLGSVVLNPINLMSYWVEFDVMSDAQLFASALECET